MGHADTPGGQVEGGTSTGMTELAPATLLSPIANPGTNNTVPGPTFANDNKSIRSRGRCKADLTGWMMGICVELYILDGSGFDG